MTHSTHRSKRRPINGTDSSPWWITALAAPDTAPAGSLTYALPVSRSAVLTLPPPADAHSVINAYTCSCSPCVGDSTCLAWSVIYDRHEALSDYWDAEGFQRADGQQVQAKTDKTTGEQTIRSPRWDDGSMAPLITLHDDSALPSWRDLDESQRAYWAKVTPDGLSPRAYRRHRHDAAHAGMFWRFNREEVRPGAGKPLLKSVEGALSDRQRKAVARVDVNRSTWLTAVEAGATDEPEAKTAKRSCETTWRQWELSVRVVHLRHAGLPVAMASATTYPWGTPTQLEGSRS